QAIRISLLTKISRSSTLAGTLFLLSRNPVDHQRKSHGFAGLLGHLKQEALAIGRYIIGDIAGRLGRVEERLGSANVQAVSARLDRDGHHFAVGCKVKEL